VLQHLVTWCESCFVCSTLHTFLLTDMPISCTAATRERTDASWTNNDGERCVSCLIRLFWRCLTFLISNSVRTRLTRWQIHKRHADTPINLLARTCRIAWRLGAGRLPLSPISFCFRSTTGGQRHCTLPNP
jgi:hypothetical protein